VDQRERAGGWKGGCAITAQRLGSREKQDRSQPLSAGQQTVANRPRETRVRLPLRVATLGNQCVERLLDAALLLREIALERFPLECPGGVCSRGVAAFVHREFQAGTPGVARFGEKPLACIGVAGCLSSPLETLVDKIAGDLG